MFGLIYNFGSSFSSPVIYTICGSIILTALLYVHHLIDKKNDQPTLHYKDTSFASHIICNCKRMSQPFTPPFWARNAHCQTILGTLLGKVGFSFQREYLQLRDKGTIALDWGESVSINHTCPVLIVIPGMAGDAHGVSFLCKEGYQRGFRTVVFNKRGHGESKLTTPKLQSFGDPADLCEAIKHIHGKYGQAKLVAIGVSAGSALLCSYLGEYGSSVYLSVTVALCPGYESELLFKGGFRKPYDTLLLRGLKKILHLHSQVLSKVIDTKNALQSSNLWDYEEQVYCKLYGYPNMTQYWEKNEPMRDISHIAIPVLCISSLDDPVFPKDNIPFHIFNMYPNFMLLATHTGGHCGFIEHSTLEPWGDKLAVDYLIAALGYIESKEEITKVL